MRSIEQINKELKKNKEIIKNLKEKRNKRLKANRQKLKDKLGAHIAHDNKSITLSNYKKFTSITKDDLENYHKTINHLKNISNQMKYTNNENNKGSWQMQNFQSVCMWLAAKFRDKENKPKKANKESNKQNLNSYNTTNKKQNYDKNKNYKQNNINLFNEYKN